MSVKLKVIYCFIILASPKFFELQKRIISKLYLLRKDQHVQGR